MAKYIEMTGNVWLYALDECEDYVILDAYLVIKASGRGNDKAVQTFEHYHLDVGGLLSDTTLLAFNSHLRRMGRDPIVLVNGHTTSYSALRDHQKANARRAIIERISALDDHRRAVLIEDKRYQASNLPERDYVASPPPPDAAGALLQRHEVEMRRAALAQAQQEAAAEVPANLALTTPPTVEGDGKAESPVEPVKIRITRDNLAVMKDRIKAATAAAIEAHSISRRQAVLESFDEIEEARAQGVTWDELAAILADLGLTALLLERYHMEQRRERGIYTNSRPAKSGA